MFGSAKKNKSSSDKAAGETPEPDVNADAPVESLAKLESLTEEMREEVEHHFEAALAAVPDIAAENAAADRGEEVLEEEPFEAEEFQDEPFVDEELTAEDFSEPAPEPDAETTPDQIAEAAPAAEDALFTAAAHRVDEPATEDVHEAESDAAILAELAAAEEAAAQRAHEASQPDDPAVKERPAITDLRRPAPETIVTRVSFIEAAAPWIIWISLALVVASIGYAVMSGGPSGTAWIILAGGAVGMLALLAGGAATNAFSPIMLTSMLLHRVRGRDRADSVTLAGRDILTPLGIAEEILNVDLDARLVTTRDGVVVYANDAYVQIAEDAGVRGPSGLPPRIDRLFGQSGSESRKIFRLCRAAKSGDPTEEIITQMMGTDEKGPVLRRFEISMRPMRDKGGHIAWRLREQEVEDIVDTLSSAYAKYPRPVFGLEPSGRLAWYNEALAEWVGTIHGNLQIGDFILGETAALIDNLWEDDADTQQARMRRRGGGGLDVELSPFLRGGIGEGFVCVELQPENAQAALDESAAIVGDMSEAPFGVAVIEGDIGSDAYIADANKMFADIFDIDDNRPGLAKCFDEKTIRDLASALKSRSTNAALARPVEVRLGEGPSAKIMHLHARPVKRRRGSYGKRQTVLYSVDVSFQKRMEEDYSQDQKLKTIGHLAGSIAHDFNNLLLVIMGSCEFLMRRHAAGDPSYPDLVLIQQNAQRAKNLTSNLLAFSRKQTLQSEILSVTEMLRDFSPFLNRSVTERVELDVINGRGLPKVKADKGQLELAIMNLAVNARDAMPTGGKIRIETKTVPGDGVAEYGYAVLEPVDHVLIEVADTGTGVPPEIADKIFEPFFTTKGEGKGTGLGLSTVYGVIGQMGGRIFLHNRPGKGATFRIFLPAYQMDEEEEAREAAAAREARKPEAADLTGKGRILIVEDEDGARSIIVRALQMCGYEITEATDGDEALEIIEDADKPYDLVLTDIMMPEMDGPTLIQTAGDKLGGAKVIFMSGYAETAMRDKLEAISGAGYLQKPFSLKVVAAKVKEALSA